MLEMSKTKAVVAAIGAFVEALKLILLDNVIDMNEWASLAVSLLILGSTIYGVFRIPNKVIPSVETGNNV